MLHDMRGTSDRILGIGWRSLSGHLFPHGDEALDAIAGICIVPAFAMFHDEEIEERGPLGVVEFRSGHDLFLFQSLVIAPGRALK